MIGEFFRAFAPSLRRDAGLPDESARRFALILEKAGEMLRRVEYRLEPAIQEMLLAKVRLVHHRRNIAMHLGNSISRRGRPAP